MADKKKPAVVLSSGGLDSTTVLAIAREQGFDLYSLSFNYGQRHAFELAAAERVARELDVKQHLVIRTDLTGIGGSALTADIDVPKNRITDKGESQDIPITYVPARNTIFLSYALAWAEVLGAADIFLGVNAVDYSGYPDCRPDFLKAFEQTANLGTKEGSTGSPFKLHAPLIELSKKEIIEVGTRLGVDYSMTHSCYDPEDGIACGRCDACILRLRGFSEAGLKDPAPYVDQAG